MTVREILTVGHPVLRHRAEEIDPADLATAELQELIADLIDTMRHANGAASLPTRSVSLVESPSSRSTTILDTRTSRRSR